LQLIQEGAEDYLVKNPCNSDALVRAVRYAFLRRGSQASKSRASSLPADQGRVVAVIGAKGGLGATTIAYNLAAELRLQTEEKVLLGDLDIHTGQVSFLAGVEPQYSFLNAIENQNRLDVSLWEALVTEGPLGGIADHGFAGAAGRERPEGGRLDGRPGNRSSVVSVDGLIFGPDRHLVNGLSR